MIRFSHAQCRGFKFKPKPLPGVLSLVVMLLLSAGLVSVAKAVVTDPADPWLQEDIIALNAAITAEVLTIQVVEMTRVSISRRGLASRGRWSSGRPTAMAGGMFKATNSY